MQRQSKKRFKVALKQCRNCEEFNEELKRGGIHLEFAFRRRNSRAVDDIQGIRFIKDGFTFKASDVSRQFSYSKLDAQLSWNMQKTQTEIEPKQQPIKQEIEQNYSITDILIESNGMGLLTPLNTPQEEAQAPSCRNKRRKTRRKRIEE